MEITQEKVNDVAVISLNGRLNVTTTGDLEAVFNKLIEEKETKVLVECRDLEYISSAGLRVLLIAQKKVNALGTEMKIIGVHESVKEIFDITGFSGIMKID